MRGVMPDEIERARILARDELDSSVALDRAREIDERAVERHGDAALGERGGDAFGDVDARNAGLELTGRPVGECDRYHVCAPVALSRRYEST